MHTVKATKWLVGAASCCLKTLERAVALKFRWLGVLVESLRCVQSKVTRTSARYKPHYSIVASYIWSAM